MTTFRNVALGTLLSVVAMLLVFGTTDTAEAANIVVDTFADIVDDDGSCSLREAITSANTNTASGSTSGECAAGGSSDAISLGAGTYALALSGAGEDNNATGDLDISADLTVGGAGAGSTVIDGGALDRVLQITSGATVGISNVTITNGSTSANGAGIYNRGTLTLTNTTITGNASTNGNSGGIYNYLATATLNSSTVSNNTSLYDGAGIFKVGGTLTLTGSTVSGNTGRNSGGIKSDNGGTLTLTNSTVSGNNAEYGAGINNDATLTVTATTVSGNTASAAGGGIFTNFGTLTLTNSILSGNSAVSSGGGIYNSQATITIVNSTFSSNSGGGIRSDASGTVNMTNTIVANTTSGSDCLGAGTFNSNDYNLDSDSTCNLIATNDLPGVDPLLGSLQNNGGSTFTHALQSGSPAIDAGDDGSAPATDQIGTARPQGSASDIGAFEVAAATPVPGLSQWGLIAMALALTSVFTWRTIRRRKLIRA